MSATLPLDQLSSEEIEDTMTMLPELGITVTESDESEEPVAPKREPAKAGGNLGHDDTGRTDDPVRMYLWEMRSIQLLSREGEVAIAKRIRGWPRDDARRHPRKPVDVRRHFRLA